jgi:hypothetical protein
VRIWQANLGKRILAYVPMVNGEVQEEGDFRFDGVAFPAAEVVLDFLDPAGSDGSVLPNERIAWRTPFPGGKQAIESGAPVARSLAGVLA